MTAAILPLPGIRPGRDLDAGRMMPLQDALRIGILPYATEAAARQAIRRELVPGVSRRRRMLGGWEIFLDPFFIDPWLRARGRVAITDWRCATLAQRQAWARDGRMKFSRRVSRARRVAAADSHTGKN